MPEETNPPQPSPREAELEAKLKELQGQLESERGKVKRYRAAMRPASEEDQGALYENIAFSMRDSGFSQQEVDQYLEMAKKAREEQEKGGKPKPRPKPDGEEPTVEDLLKELGLDDETADPTAELRQKMAELEKKLERSQEEQRKERFERARKRLDRQVDQLVKSHPKLKALIDSRTGIEDDDVKRKSVEEILRKSIRDDVWKSTVETLKSRADASNGKWDEDWIDEAAATAVESVEEKFRSVIGDPARLKRSPETVTGLEGFDPGKKPVEPPRFEPGKARGELDAKAKDYAVDSLMRGLSEVAKGGETKV